MCIFASVMLQKYVGIVLHTVKYNDKANIVHVYTEQTVRQVLAEQEITGADVLVEDKGALDWILRARLETALLRAREDAQ